MRIARWLVLLTVAFISLALVAPTAFAKKPSLAKWKANFDYSGAKYKIKVSNVSHPAIKGVFAGFAIRDALWKATKGQIYFEYIPFSMLGGEVEVLNQLQMGAIQGMAVSSVASTNLGPRMGLVNLPFLINSYEKMDKFAGNKKLYQYFLDGMKHQGIMGLDVTAYGRYGWATTIPVKTIADAKKVKFRIAEAAVNKLLYKSWGFNPVVMPWPDVPTALKQGVITGLDHTLIVSYLTKKFEVAKNYTPVNYAQGLFIWIFNEAWFKSLPEDLQKIFVKTIHEVCADYRNKCKTQEEDAAAGAKKSGVKFWDLSEADLGTLKKEGNKVHEEFADQIGAEYLKEVQKFLGYSE
ncbi:TRAP transporter substrate-binding protein [Dethiosulfatarculus sandiegensis]|uniref:C4-dicarboxylate ABC transporter substrate-binding protein n=1 Tax=Dethiosulfatarculus sandiegensis TaxID=1429043 RepID=A0A0D2HVY4_9BACT|nr:TRAP transporter substrate-binding protein [Dethiosulfatarculus sandiegensis]KIX14528.1 C4-dicarboxylate ABC transporter substrate-binding protein [Dethiosulfatarculus sandiegensis]